ncbi:AraC family transcriptional regulator ligand-binding domain-containing protein [Burkholderia gladioli]|uniref:AraC family transcriptional regulator ligand-binding domain-containing protein n=1 Tax=Burkholderia gladioli TaxID=28095 RepID=UPI00163F9646|nr:AraC family transcriptional regulator ligand-binding domain-containing protein [Burkholderia gladioli]
MTRRPTLGADLASVRPAPLHTAIIAIRLLQKRGVPVSDLIAESGITESDLSRPDMIISHEQEMIVFANAQRLTGTDITGALIGKAIPITAYGVRGHAMLVAPTLRAAMSLGFSYPLLAISYFKISFHEIGSDAVFLLDGYAYRQDLRVFSSLMCLAAVQREILDSTRAPVEFIRAEFDFPQPDDHEELTRILGCPIVFNAQSTSLSIPKHYLDTELPFHHEIEFEIARGECARQEPMMAAWQPEHIVTRALQTLHRLDGRLDAHGLAAELGMSLRSMQRELGHAGLSFRTLLDQVRLARALDPLFQSGKFGPEAHSKMFGYSTKFAFERAKDRWTAKSKSKISG